MTGSSHQPDQETWYELRLQGHLDPKWAAWLDGFELTQDGDGTTVARGPVVDQAALHGLLGRVRDLGLPLLSVTRVETGPSHNTTASHNSNGV